MPDAENVPGWMTLEELQWLRETAARMDSVLEIGSWLGRSTFALCASGCREVWAVDNFCGFGEAENQSQFLVPAGVEPFVQFFRTVGGFRNLHIVPVSSAEAARVLQGDFDFVFIDGGHDYEQVCSDIRLWRPRARRLLAGHDLIMPEVRRAVSDCLQGKFTNPVSTIWQELR